MPISTIPLSELQKVGVGLKRPEDVAVGRDGRVWASDEQSACAILRKDGTLKRVGQAGGAPNGINFDLQGRIIIANFGIHAKTAGPLQRLDPVTGTIETLCSDVGGRTLTSSNYPVVMKDGSIYCTHSTWAPTLALGLAKGPGDGFIYRVDAQGRARTVAEGLSFPNGCCVDPKGKSLYVVQTTAANIMRFDIAPDGSLRPGFPYGPTFGIIPDAPPAGDLEPRQRGRLGYADGCAFDQEGNLWVTMVMANRIFAITPSLQIKVIVDDPERRILNMPTNITFGGPDMRDVYFGSIASDYIAKARSPVPGLPLAHQR